MSALATAPRRGRGKSAKSLELIAAAYTILAEIQPASVRAVCYQLFIRKLLDSMSKANTGRVSTLLTYARKMGIIPWAWVVDESREAERIASWDDPAEFGESVRRQYRKDYWAHQSVRVEVWSEKAPSAAHSRRSWMSTASPSA